MSVSMDSMASMLNTAANNPILNQSSGKLQNTLDKVSGDSSEEELKQVCKDFASYFVEEVLKEVKENMAAEEEDSDSSISAMTDFQMDSVIETLADDLVDEVGSGFVQQLYEQMKRNYNL